MPFSTAPLWVLVAYIKTDEASIVDASVVARHCRANKGGDVQTTQDPKTGCNVKTGSDGKWKVAPKT